MCKENGFIYKYDGTPNFSDLPADLTGEEWNNHYVSPPPPPPPVYNPCGAGEYYYGGYCYYD